MTKKRAVSGSESLSNHPCTGHVGKCGARKWLTNSEREVGRRSRKIKCILVRPDSVPFLLEKQVLPQESEPERKWKLAVIPLHPSQVTCTWKSPAGRKGGSHSWEPGAGWAAHLKLIQGPRHRGLTRTPQSCGQTLQSNFSFFCWCCNFIYYKRLVPL